MAIWVFAEAIDGQPASIALEILTKARSFGDEVAALYFGPAGNDAFAALGAHGASTIYHLDPPGDALPAASVAGAIADLVSAHTPRAILFGLTYTDRDVVGRLSARIGAPVLSNAIDVAIDGDIAVTNEINGGVTKVVSRFTGDGTPLVIVRPKVFAAEPGEPQTPTVVPVAYPDVGHAGAAVIVERHVEESEGPDLAEADVVIAGGRGLGAAEHFAMVERLAGLLGGAIGATRAVIDAGWVPYSLQVGQTGKTVKPNLYLACGISGAMQHLVGMKDAGTIIAVNKDPEAPIFGVADLGVIGDVHKVLPKLIEALENR
jgi:electron transfer flavoprotein alpha subunit